jgi:hypothetical protein
MRAALFLARKLRLKEDLVIGHREIGKAVVKQKVLPKECAGEGACGPTSIF